MSDNPTTMLPGMRQVPYIRLSTNDEWSYPDQRANEDRQAKELRLLQTEQAIARSRAHEASGCTSSEPCCHPDMCKKASICLGSDEGVAYQETCMKAFFDWLLPQCGESNDHE